MLTKVIFTASFIIFWSHIEEIIYPPKIIPLQEETYYPEQDTYYIDKYCTLFHLGCPDIYASDLPLERTCNKVRNFCCSKQVPLSIKVLCPECTLSLHFPGHIPATTAHLLKTDKHCNHRIYRNDPKAKQPLTKKDLRDIQKHQKNLQLQLKAHKNRQMRREKKQKSIQCPHR